MSEITIEPVGPAEQEVLDKRDPDFTSRASQMPGFYDEWIGEA